MGDLASFTASLGPRRGFLRGTRATDWYERGCALEARDPAGATHAYARAVAGCPDFPDAHNNLARLHHDAGRVADAESHYRLAICGNSEVALYWFNLGVAIEDQDRVAEAVDAYERALALDARLADAHFNLARLLERAGRRSGDELTLRRAIRHLAHYRALDARSAR
ncbi:MAG: tetratricopeptide repeat protein [Deltaproteobacteria bacterium]|nr:tetratricopeptide repeat protein [Deltaproteobacteria bacterium]MCW5805250.1 tetratricopeptide repeat protein [Deltaproteobacteria bacterium]